MQPYCAADMRRTCTQGIVHLRAHVGDLGEELDKYLKVVESLLASKGAYG